MSSFYAELVVAGKTYPVRQCQFGFTQATDQRGRVQAKVRHGLLHLTLDVPDDDQLLDWAHAAYKPLNGHITFFETSRQSPRETVSFKAGHCVGYQETFVSGEGEAGAYVCQLVLSTDGLVLTPGGPAGPFIAPAARSHGSPLGAALTAERAHAAAWAAARAKALAPTRIAALYAAYKASKKDPAKVRSQAEWWGVAGQRGGVRHTIEGSVGEYQADKLFAAQGHTKLNHGGKLLGLLDKPQGPGLDGVWRNASPPPDYIITETKTTTQPGAKPSLSKGQMSNPWVLRGKRLSRAVGEKQAKQIQLAMLKGQVSKRVLHIDHAGNLTQYTVDAAGKMSLLN